jgi:hypothetical protein
MFFRFMAAMDEFADKLEKEGKPEAAKAWRTHAQRAAGLGEQEGALLKEIASNCNLALANKDTELKTTIESALGQKADFISLRDAANPQLDRLSAERKEISDAHLDRMKAALGEESFRKLDAYVKDVFKSSTVVPVNNQSPGANASPSGSNTAAPPAKSSPPARSVAPMQPPSASKSTQRPEGVQ